MAGFPRASPTLLLPARLTRLPSRLGSEFLPALNEGALYVTFTAPGNLSLTEGRQLAPRLKTLLRRTPEVDGLLSQLGRPEDGTNPTLPNNFEVFVKLKPLDQWRPDMKTVDDLIVEMAGNLSEIPGLEYSFSSRFGGRPGTRLRRYAPQCVSGCRRAAAPRPCHHVHA